MKNISKPIETHYATKGQLLDYVSKFEFEEFRGDMRDFRTDTTNRFNSIDKRFDRLEEDFRVKTGTVLQEMRTISKTTMKYIKGVEAKVNDILVRV